MTIEQLLQMPMGKENRTGGFQLTVKVARKTVKINQKHLQWVVFMDETGEIPGEVLLPKYNPLIKNQKIHITVCWLQAGEKGKKLYVDQWYPITYTSDEGIAAYEAGKKNYSPPDEYEDDIEGRCLTWHIAAFIEGYVTKTGQLPECTDENQETLKKWVKFNCERRIT